MNNLRRSGSEDYLEKIKEVLREDLRITAKDKRLLREKSNIGIISGAFAAILVGIILAVLFAKNSETVQNFNQFNREINSNKIPLTTNEKPLKKEKEVYSVTIDSDPTGATVSVYNENEEMLSENILSATIYLESGSYKLTFKKEGYKPVTQSIEVQSKSVVVHQKLEKEKADKAIMYGRVELNVYPWAEIWIDGKSFGEVPPAIAKTLKEGKHVLTLKQGKIVLLTETIIIKQDRMVRKHYKFGMLNISAHPWAEIYIDGKPYGEVPPPKEILLLEGNHILMLKKGDIKLTENITITPEIPLKMHKILK